MLRRAATYARLPRGCPQPGNGALRKESKSSRRHRFGTRQSCRRSRRRICRPFFTGSGTMPASITCITFRKRSVFRPRRAGDTSARRWPNHRSRKGFRGGWLGKFSPNTQNSFPEPAKGSDVRVGGQHDLVDQLPPQPRCLGSRVMVSPYARLLHASGATSTFERRVGHDDAVNTMAPRAPALLQIEEDEPPLHCGASCRYRPRVRSPLRYV